MNKSIYEEAKRDLISLTAKFVIPSVEETEYGCLYDWCHFYNTLDEQEENYLKKIEQALEQAQKQEKLLEQHIKMLVDAFNHNLRNTGEYSIAYNNFLRTEIKMLEKILDEEGETK